MEKVRSVRKELTVSRRERLIVELRPDPKLAAGYLNVVAEAGDARLYLAELGAVVEAEGVAKVAKAVGLPRESLYRAVLRQQSTLFDAARQIASSRPQDGGRTGFPTV